MQDTNNQADISFDIDGVIEAARELVSAQRYFEAARKIESCISQLKSAEKTAGFSSASRFRSDLLFESVLEKATAAEDPAAVLRACGIVALCAAASELYVFTLGHGIKAALLIQTATDAAEELSEALGEPLMQSKTYSRMIWFYYVMPDKKEALRLAYRLADKYRDSGEGWHIKYVCENIVDTPDWNSYRHTRNNFYSVVPDGIEKDVLENTILSVPFFNESYMAAVRDSILTSLERGKHTKQNDYIWMVSLIDMEQSCFKELCKAIPTDKLSETERQAFLEDLFAPVTRHIIIREGDGFKTGYNNTAKLALKYSESNRLTSLACLGKIKEAYENKGIVSGFEPYDEEVERMLFGRTDIKLPSKSVSESGTLGIGDYFKCRILTDHRIFLSSTFKDMIAERDYLITYTIPMIDLVLRENGMRLSVADLRGIRIDGTEEQYNKECFKYCLNEIDKSDLFIGLIGKRYGWIPLNSDTTDDAFFAVVDKTASEHGMSIQSMFGKSMTHIEMLYALMNISTKNCLFYVRNLKATTDATMEMLASGVYLDGDSGRIKNQIADIASAFGVSRIAPENEPGCNLQLYNATYENGSVTGLEGLSKNIFNSVISRLVLSSNTSRVHKWYTRLISFWSETAHLTIRHPKLDELLGCSDSFIFVTGEEGIGKTVLLAQYWECLREQSLVIPIEVLLESEIDTYEKLIKRVNETLPYFRLMLPRGNMFTNDVCLIIDGLERFANKGYTLSFSGDFEKSFNAGVRIILCGQSKYVKAPEGFKVFRVDEPPATARDIVRCTVYKNGKLLNEDAISRIAGIAEKSGGNPLYTELVTKGILHLLREQVGSGRSDSVRRYEEMLDGTVGSAAAMIISAAMETSDKKLKKDYEIIGSVVRELVNSKRGAATASEIYNCLKAKGELPPRPRNKLFSREGDRYDKEQQVKFVRIYTLLKPILLFDHTASVFTLAHKSFALHPSVSAFGSSIKKQ